jgi:hypothetical protein
MTTPSSSLKDCLASANDDTDATTNTSSTPRTPASQRPPQEDKKISSKLFHRITQLSSSASKESIQTLAKWIFFHMSHHPVAISQTLRRLLTSNTTTATGMVTAAVGAEVNDQYHHLLVTWNILHELLISGSSLGGSTVPVAANSAVSYENELWLQRKEIMEALGESVIRPGMEFLIDCLKKEQPYQQQEKEMILQVKEKVKQMLGVWEELDAFQSPTLLEEMKRLILKMDFEKGEEQEEEKVSDDVNNLQQQKGDGNSRRGGNLENGGMEDVSFDVSQEGSYHDKDEDESGDVNQDIEMDEKEEEDDEEEEMIGGSSNLQGSTMVQPKNAKDDNEDESPTTATTTSTATTTATTKKDAVSAVAAVDTFDFENEGISQETVPVQDLVRACKAVATLQITRDMRNESSHNLTSILSGVPKDVLDACRLERDRQRADGISENVDFKQLGLNAIPDEVLDLDIARALANVKLHREIIQRQREFKKECIELLIKSRCNFGSMEAASLFYELEEVREKLNKRKALVLDAMELEGIESEAMEEGSNNNENKDDDEDEDIDNHQEEDFVNNNSFAWFTREDANAKKQKLLVE